MGVPSFIHATQPDNETLTLTLTMSASSSPSPSPPSSPALGPVDSSPPSSPSIRGLLATPPESPAPTDPYAGSNKSTQRPPQYEAQRRVKPLGWDPARALPARTDAHDSVNDPFAGPARTSPVAQYTHAPSPCAASDNQSKNASVPTTAYVDLYAASARNIWPPPQREKKPFSRSTSAASAYTVESDLSDDPVGLPTVIVPRPLCRGSQCGDVNLHGAGPSPDTEEKIWDDVLGRAVDKLAVEINLAYVLSFSSTPTVAPRKLY